MTKNSLEVTPLPIAATKSAALEELRRCLKMPVAPVPSEALRMLHEAASEDTGGSQACRYFLFWLAGQQEPTGHQGSGGFELRRLDGQLRQAAIDVLTWWSGPTQRDQPLYDILSNLRIRFSNPDSESMAPRETKVEARSPCVSAADRIL